MGLSRGVTHQSCRGCGLPPHWWAPKGQSSAEEPRVPLGSGGCVPRPIAARGGRPCHGYAANSAVIYIPGRTGRLPGSPGRLRGGFIGRAVYTARAELTGPRGAAKRRPHPHPHPPPRRAAGWLCPTLTPSPQVWVSPCGAVRPHAELLAPRVVFLPGTGGRSRAVCLLLLLIQVSPQTTPPFANQGCPQRRFPRPQHLSQLTCSIPSRAAGSIWPRPL